MKSNLFVHIPIQQLGIRLATLMEKQLQPEIACHEAALDQLDFHLLKNAAAQLHQQGLVTTLHAPFSGFSSGSGRGRVTDHSHRIVEQSLTLAAMMNSCRIVFHPGLAFASSVKSQQQWLDNSIPFWSRHLEQAREQNTVICIENIWEQHPEYLLRLLQEMASPVFGHVFDIGHWNLFVETPLAVWLDRIGPYIKHLHLHDNRGNTDDHRVLGEGEAPLLELYQWFRATPVKPTLTLENRRFHESLQSLEQLRKDLPELWMTP